MMKRLTVGNMAKINNISAQTLRYYDRIGLLSPNEIDPQTGYRYYHITQSVKLDLISHMKYLGMSLDKIRELFEENDQKRIAQNIDLQLEHLQEEKRKLEIMEKAALKFKHNLEEYALESKKTGAEVRTFKERKIFCYDGRVNIYESDMETYEYILRELKKQVILKNLPMVYFCNAGSIIRERDIRKAHFISTEIFLFLDEFFPPGDGVAIVPEGRYACISFKGEEGFSNEVEEAKRLLAFIRDQGFEIAGDYLCEVITEFPLFEKDHREMFIRLQIPVK